MGTGLRKHNSNALVWKGYTMKLRIKAKPLSVHSEVEVSTTDEEVVYCADTDPLSSPRLTRFKDAEYRELATITTAHLDAKDRAHHIVMADGHTFDIKRKFRTPASTVESYLTVEGADWQVVMTRGWTNRFEVRDTGGRVYVEARQVPMERNDTYELNVKISERMDELMVMCIVARSIMAADAPTNAM